MLGYPINAPIYAYSAEELCDKLNEMQITHYVVWSHWVYRDVQPAYVAIVGHKGRKDQ